MKSSSLPSTMSTIAVAKRLNNSLALAAFTILIYDYALTVASEFDHFWKSRRLSAMSVLFAMNRYLVLLGHIPVIFEYFSHLPPQRCRQLQVYHRYFVVFIQTIVGVLLIIRMYALYERSKRVLAGLTIFAVIIIMVALITENVKTTSVTANESLHLPHDIGCDLSLTPEQGVRTAIGWITLMAFDAINFVLTMMKTMRTRQAMRAGLFYVFIRDGSIYFAVLLVGTTTNVLTFVIPQIGDVNRGVATTVTNALSSILVTRIFLNIWDPALIGRAQHLGRRWTPSSVTADGVTAQTTVEFYMRTGSTTSTTYDVEDVPGFPLASLGSSGSSDVEKIVGGQSPAKT